MKSYNPLRYMLASLVMIGALMLSLAAPPRVEAAVTHSSTVRDALCTAVRTACGSNFKIKIRNSSNTVLVSITVSAWSSVSSGAITCDPDSTAITTSGTAANFIVTDSSDTTVFSGSVGTSGTDITVATVTFTSGVNLDLTSFSYTAPN